MPSRPSRNAVPVRAGWLVALLALILAGWAVVGWGLLRQHRAHEAARARLLPRTARTTGTVVALDSLSFSRGEYYYRARYRFTANGRRVEGAHERKGWPPGHGGVWRPDLRVGGPVEVCYAPTDPAQNGALLYVVASPCPGAP